MILTLLLLACRDADKSPAPVDDSAPTSGDDSAGDDSGTPEDSGTFTVPLDCPAGEDPPPSSVWSEVGLAPAGDARFMSTSAALPDRVWIGAHVGGIFRSIDHGNSWSPLTMEGASPHAEGPIYVDPEVPDRIYYTEAILWRIDGDVATELPLGSHVPDERVRAVTRAAGRLWAITATSIVYSSDDDGDSWTEVSIIRPDPPDGAHGARSLDGKYWSLVETPAGALLAVQQDGDVFRSEDGLSWATVSLGDAALATLTVRDGVIWLGSGNLLYRSEDDGRSFASVADAGAPLEAASIGPNGEIALATADTVLIDGVVEDPGVTELFGLTYLGDGALLLGYGEGLLRKAPGGAWVDSSEGFVDRDLAVLGVHPRCPGIIVVGTQCVRGIYTSHDGGQTLTHDISAYAHYVMTMAWSPHTLGELWVTTDDELLVSEDFGASFEDRVPAPLHLHGLALDPFVPGTAIVGSVGSGDWPDRTGMIYRTEDAGETWDTSGAGLPPMEGSVQTLLMLEEPAGVVLAGTYKGGVYHDTGSGVGLYRAIDGGVGWSWIESFPELDVRLLRSCGTDVWAVGGVGLYWSGDAGMSWELRVSGEYATVACHAARVVVAGHDGIQRSTDHGQSWEDWGDGIDMVGGTGVGDLDFSPDGATVYLASPPRGLWTRSW